MSDAGQRAERDELIERVLTGALDRDADEVKAAVGSDPQLAGELDSLLALRDRLEEPNERREVLVAARAEPWSEGEAAARRAIEAALAAGGPQRSDLPSIDAARPGPSPAAHGPAGPRRWIPALAAVAAAALALVLWWPDGAADPATGGGDPVIYLGAPLPGAAPAGPSVDYARLTWALELPTGWAVEIKVFDDRPEATSSAALAQHRGEPTDAWEPPGTDSWPSAIRWTVTPVGPDGSRQSPYSVRAWRSGP